MRFPWQRKNEPSPPVLPETESDDDAHAQRVDSAAERILEEAGLLGAFAWRSYQMSGRGLILFRLEDLENREIDLEEKFEYFTVSQLNNVSAELIDSLERHVQTYVPETDFVVVILGESLNVRVVELSTPLSAL